MNETILVPNDDEDMRPRQSLSDTLFLIGDRINVIYANVGCILELLLLILFIYLIKTKKSWNLKGFVIMLSVGYIVDLAAQLCWVVNILSGEESIFWINATQASFIYAVASSGIWNTLLSLNRCTAVLWPMKHSRLWSIRNICLYSIPILIYPLAIQGHIVFDDRFYDEGIGLATSKTDFLLVNRLILGISNTILAIIMLTATSVVYLKNHKTHSSSSTRRWEIKMLIHCSFSSLFMCIFSLFFWLAAVLNPIQQTIAIGSEYLALFMYSTFHYGSILMLFVVNKQIRNLFYSFYTCGKYKMSTTTVVHHSSSVHSTRPVGSAMSMQRHRPKLTHHFLSDRQQQMFVISP